MYRPHLINHPKSFHSSSVFETGLSDIHKLTLTVLKVFHAKHKPKIIQYRHFNHFDNASFRIELLQEFYQNVHPGEFEKLKYISYKSLISICSQTQLHMLLYLFVSLSACFTAFLFFVFYFFLFCLLLPPPLCLLTLSLKLTEISLTFLIKAIFVVSYIFCSFVFFTGQL